MLNLLFKSSSYSSIFLVPLKKVVPYGLETVGASLFVAKRIHVLAPTNSLNPKEKVIYIHLENWAKMGLKKWKNNSELRSTVATVVSYGRDFTEI